MRENNPAPLASKIHSDGYPATLSRYRNEIDHELHAILEGYSAPMYDMLRYQLGWIDQQGNPTYGASGKAFRPTLCLLSCEAISGDYQVALPAAAAVELVHNFSLIHDDVQDDDAMRRNRPSVWAIWGKPQAINAGTAMRVLASVTLMRLVENQVSMDKFIQAQQLLDQSCLKLIEGQFLDIEFESRINVSMGEYLDMVKGKTASLIACALELGALLANDTRATRLAFNKIGLNLGMSFQIRDDILGIWGNEEKTGKSSESDLWLRKKTFPVIYAWDVSDRKEKQALEDIYRQVEMDTVGLEKVLHILEHVNAREHAQQMIDRACEEAFEEIGSLIMAPWAYQSFEEILDFLTHRDY